MLAACRVVVILSMEFGYFARTFGVGYHVARATSRASPDEGMLAICGCRPALLVGTAVIRWVSIGALQSRKGSIRARKPAGFSACTQWPTPGTVTKRQAGKRAWKLEWLSGLM